VKTGDIYAFYNERLDCWHACQITGFCDESKDRNGKPRPAVLYLDWSGKHLPTPADFPFFKPLQIKDIFNNDHFYATSMLSA